MLNRYELLVAKEESERVDTLRYSWQKLQSLAVHTLMNFGICYAWVMIFISPRNGTKSSLQAMQRDTV